MKRIQSVISGLIISSIALAMAPSLFAQSSPGVAKVVRVTGQARYSTGNNIWQQLKAGTKLRPGTIIQTAARSYVDVVLDNPDANAPLPVMATVKYPHPVAEQDMVRVWENTVLAIDKLTVADTGAERITETQLDLRSGEIFGTVKKLSPASKYEVKIPNGVAGIRGTIYHISSVGVVTVLEGSLVIAYVAPDGTVVAQPVTAGQQFDARTGKVTTIPGPLFNALRTFFQESLPSGEKRTVPTTLTVDHTIYFVSPVEESGGSVSDGGTSD